MSSKSWKSGFVALIVVGAGALFSGTAFGLVWVKTMPIAPDLSPSRQREIATCALAKFNLPQAKARLRELHPELPNEWVQRLNVLMTPRLHFRGPDPVSLVLEMPTDRKRLRESPPFSDAVSGLMARVSDCERAIDGR